MPAVIGPLRCPRTLKQQHHSGDIKEPRNLLELPMLLTLGMPEQTEASTDSRDPVFQVRSGEVRPEWIRSRAEGVVDFVLRARQTSEQHAREGRALSTTVARAVRMRIHACEYTDARPENLKTTCGAEAARNAADEWCGHQRLPLHPHRGDNRRNKCRPCRGPCDDTTARQIK